MLAMAITDPPGRGRAIATNHLTCCLLLGDRRRSVRHNSVNKIEGGPYQKGNFLSPGAPPSGRRSPRSRSPEPQAEDVARRRSNREREQREPVKSSGSATLIPRLLIRRLK